MVLLRIDSELERRKLSALPECLHHDIADRARAGFLRETALAAKIVRQTPRALQSETAETVLFGTVRRLDFLVPYRNENR